MKPLESLIGDSRGLLVGRTNDIKSLKKKAPFVMLKVVW